MTQESDFIAAEGVAFQGRITASVSHELKNVFATISETSGLLADLTELGMSGRPLDAAELRGCADAIVDEVKRGFRVVKNLNVFAHSTDQPIAEVDLGELVSLVVDLAGYLSFASAVVLEGPEGPQARLTTRPLLLEDLLYRAIVHAFRVVGPDGSIRILTDCQTDGGRIVVSGRGSTGFEGFPGDDVQRILRALDGRLEADASDDQLQILLPPSIEAGTNE